MPSWRAIGKPHRPAGTGRIAVLTCGGGSVGIVHASARLRRRLRMPTWQDGDVSMAQADWPARAPGTCLPGQREAPRGSAHGHAD
ncbi:hypothetical protein BLA34_14775 [Ralstonia solanacearum]|nr:hypothetical protein BLA34_14775 [Ralstonia solanacearum]QVX40919.1 hypothetical protein J4H89_24415 [Ralstonia solanacearum]